MFDTCLRCRHASDFPARKVNFTRQQEERVRPRAHRATWQAGGLQAVIFLFNNSSAASVVARTRSHGHVAPRCVAGVDNPAVVLTKVLTEKQLRSWCEHLGHRWLDDSSGGIQKLKYKNVHFMVPKRLERLRALEVRIASQKRSETPWLWTGSNPRIVIRFTCTEAFSSSQD